ncbi:SPOR domain-containing protein [Roseovarius autotrophicus]|uniref:SPOR domain-containing protein n=1 Tax=Roseovarius autotrophicus TaxID=2824121 RepID=UPI001FFD0246|nr:SPOR domain-containing protein [Roseovarius autotrophicus]
MSGAREHMCGFAPSLATTAPQPQPQIQPQAAPRIADAPAPRAQPAPRTSPAPVSAPKPAAPAPVPPRVSLAAASAGTARVLTPPDPARTACANMTDVSAAYMVQHKGSPVRCGPQTAHYATYPQDGSARGTYTVLIPVAPPALGTRAIPGSVPTGTRVAPSRVYTSQRTSLFGISVPEGMKPAWEDDRLNPRRAHQTFEGKAQMEVMWTNTVPRRLIDRRSGTDVIHRFPGLQPPFTSFEGQRAAGVTVATRGVHVPDPVPARRAPTASVSSRSVPGIATAPDVSRPHYAQAGIYADPEQGRAAAQRVAAAGLPARQGKLSRDGRALTVVLAGPFASRTEAERGAQRLRGMGFGEVRLR